jgi:flagellar assembly protein FliH
MAKSKLVGEFDLDGSPLSAFNVSKAMAKAREAAFILKPGEAKNGDDYFRKVSWNEVAPPVDLTPDPVSEDEAASAAKEDTAAEGVAEDSGDPDGWDEALQSADTADGGASPVSAPDKQAANLSTSSETVADPSGEAPVAVEGLETAVPAAADPVQAAPLNLAPAPPPVIDEAQKQKIREEAYHEGFSAGKAMTESEREAELAERIADLDRLVGALSDPELLDIDLLSAQIRQSVLSLATERAGSQIDNFPEPFLDRLETMLRNVQHMSGNRELFVCQADLDVINAGLPDYKDLSQIKMRVDARLGRGDVKMRVGGGEISDLFENLTPPDVGEPEAVVAAKLDGDGVDHGIVAQGETDKDAQVAESPTPDPEASNIKKETPDTAEAVKDVAAPKVAPDVEAARDVPEAAADQLAQDTTAEKVVADTAPEAVAPNTAPDQIEQVAVEGEPVSVPATDKVALKDD